MNILNRKNVNGYLIGKIAQEIKDIACADS